MTPAGIGGCVVEMMDRGLVDFIISTGANLYHDLHHALNFTLHRGSPFVDDVELYEQGIIRIYDVLFPANVLLETDAYIRDFLVRSALEGPITTAELHYRIGLDCSSASRVRRAFGRRARSQSGRAHLYLIARHSSSDEHRVSRAAERQHADDHPNRDVNEVCAIILAGKRNGCVILGAARRRTSICRGSRRSGRFTASTRAETTISSRSRPIRWSGAGCPGPPGRSRQLGESESRRAPRYGSGLL